MATYYLEDFKPGLCVTTASHTVTSEEIFDFARKYDPQDYHLDKDAAKNSVFGGLASSGFHSASLTWGLALGTGYFDGSGLAGIGVDDLRWFRPMRADDTVHCVFRVLKNTPSRSRPDRGVIVAQYDLYNQRDEHVLSMKMIQMLKSRTTASSGAKTDNAGNGSAASGARLKTIKE